MHSAIRVHTPRWGRPVLSIIAATALATVLLVESGAKGGAGATPPRAGQESGGAVVDVTDPPYGAAGDATACTGDIDVGPPRSSNGPTTPCPTDPNATNDRAGIQQAIDDLSERGGGTVLLPESRTFLSGTLELKNKVTLRIDGVLQQSQDPDHYPHDVRLGHDIPGGVEWGVSWFHNYPLVYAGHKKNVAVTGDGMIQMTRGGEGGFSQADEDATIHSMPIGFFDVDGFEMSGLRIERANTFNVAAWQSRNGTIENLTLDARHQNSDGINLKHARNIDVVGNHLDVRDDAILASVNHNDPRAGTWWMSGDGDGPTRDIRIRENFVRSDDGGFVLVPWGTAADDYRDVEISDIEVSDNEFRSNSKSLTAWADDPFHGPTGSLGGEWNDHSPIKNINIHHNVYRDFHGNPEQSMERFRRARITNLKNDVGILGGPQVLNGDFERTGNAYWSSVGDAGATDKVSTLTSPDARRMAQRVVRSEGWGWFGYIQEYASQSVSALYQGLSLSDGLRYRLAIDVVTSGVPVRLFAQNTCTGEVVAQKSVDDNEPIRRSMTFRADGTCDSYHLGVDQGDAKGGWALINDAELIVLAEVVDDQDARISYDNECAWRTNLEVGMIENTYSEASEAGAGVELTFEGARAWVFGVRSFDYGEAEIYLDGTHQATVDFYNLAMADHQAVYDTGILDDGEHTLRVVPTGTRSDRSQGTNVGLDAFLVEDYQGEPREGKRQRCLGGETFDEVIDNTDPVLTYDGDWREFSGSTAYGGSWHTGFTAEGFVEIPFTGTRARYFAVVGPNNGQGRFYVDGDYEATVDFYSPSRIDQHMVFDTGELDAGEHALKVVLTGTRSDEAGPDGLTVISLDAVGIDMQD